MYMVRKVVYIKGSGILLHKPLSDGRMSFASGIVYEISDYGDFQRLTRNGDFVEVTEEKRKKAELTHD